MCAKVITCVWNLLWNVTFWDLGLEGSSLESHLGDKCSWLRKIQLWYFSYIQTWGCFMGCRSVLFYLYNYCLSQYLKNHHKAELEKSFGVSFNLHVVTQEPLNLQETTVAITWRRCAPRCCSNMSVAREWDDRLTADRKGRHIRNTDLSLIHFKRLCKWCRSIKIPSGHF